MAYTKEDIIRITKDEGVDFICLQFTDILGMLKSVIVTTSQLQKALDNKCMFDGSSIEGFVRIEESDMYLYPDIDTFVVMPGQLNQGKTARLICDVYKADGTPFMGDPRNILRKVIAEAEEMGYEEFCKYQELFGFGENTGIALPGEASTEGLLYTVENMNSSSLTFNMKLWTNLIDDDGLPFMISFNVTINE